MSEKVKPKPKPKRRVASAKARKVAADKTIRHRISGEETSRKDQEEEKAKLM